MSQHDSPVTGGLKADVTVIGGGGSGLSAAIAAAEKGASVIVLEKRQTSGGNSALALGLFSTRNPGQTDEETAAVGDDYFRKAMSFAIWRTNPRLVRTLIDMSADVVAWLERQGVAFNADSAFSSPQGKPKYRISGPGRGGAHVMKALAERCEALGIRVLCQTAAKKLITEGGRVTGVLADGEGGEIKVETGSVIIATGGFAGNRELLKKYFPSFNETDEFQLQGLPHQGDGLLMATAIGAATDGAALLEISGLICPWSEYLAIVSRHKDAVWVNKRGERFVDESAGFPYFTNAMFRQPDKAIYALIDEKTKQGILGEELSPMEAANLPEGSWPSQVDAELRSQEEQGHAKAAASWDEMARWLGVDPATLRATIEEYNAACERGRDGLFAKDKEHLKPLRQPPFYAIKCCVHLLVTHGDITINPRMEVLNHAGSPIPGLYAVGDDTGDVDYGAYNITLGGHSFGFAINSGRIAGENAAAYVAAPAPPKK